MPNKMVDFPIKVPKSKFCYNHISGEHCYQFRFKRIGNIMIGECSVGLSLIE
ncbi:unnamed protein product, partial [marine sediment metagenome]